MRILTELTDETRTELLKRPTAMKAFIACLEGGFDAYEMCKDTELCKHYGCGSKAVFDNAELVNKALEERGN